MSVSFCASRNCSWPTNSTNHSVPFSFSLKGRIRGLAFFADRFMRLTSAPDSVIADVIFVIDQGTHADALGIEPGAEWNVDLLGAHLAALVQVGDHANDRVIGWAHIGRVEILTNVFPVKLLPEKDEFVIDCSCRQRHGAG